MQAIEELRRLLRDSNGWKNYMESVNDLLARVAGFNRLVEDLKARVSGSTLSDILTGDDETLRKAVLGGLNIEKGRYEPRALGLFYHYYIGIGVEGEGQNAGLQRFISRIREGEDPVDAGRDIQIKVYDTDETRLLQALESLLREVVNYVGLEPREARYEANDPLAALHALADVLNASLALLPLYNKYTFILQSFYSTPAFYLKKAYGINFKLELDNNVTINNREIRTLFEDYNIKFRVIVAPEISDPVERLNKAIIGSEINSLGEKIVKIVGIIYILFNVIYYKQAEYSSLAFFRGVKDEFLNYIRTYKSSVENEYTFFSSTVELAYRDYENVYNKILSNIINVGARRYKARWGIINSIQGGEIHIRVGRYSYRVQFTEFLKHFAPLAFLGLGFIVNNEILIHYD